MYPYQKRKTAQADQETDRRTADRVRTDLGPKKGIEKGERSQNTQGCGLNGIDGSGRAKAGGEDPKQTVAKYASGGSAKGQRGSQPQIHKAVPGQKPPGDGVDTHG